MKMVRYENGDENECKFSDHSEGITLFESKWTLKYDPLG